MQEENQVDTAALIESEQLRKKDEVAEEQAETIRLLPFSTFFKYIKGADYALLIFGFLGTIIAGAILPSISLVMGQTSAAFTDNGDEDSGSLLDTMSNIAAIVMMIAMSLFIFSYVFFSFWAHLSENIVLDLRKRYIEALMKQEIAYFEVNKVEQIPAEISEIFDVIKSAIGEKTSQLSYAIFTCIFGIVYAICYGPVYAGVCIAYLPILLFILVFFGKMVQKTTLQRLNVVKQLGGIAEETLTAIKVVTSFTREERELRKFIRYAKETQDIGKRAVRMAALTTGLMKFTIFGFYAYTLYIGSWFIQFGAEDFFFRGQVYDQQTVIQTVIALITGFVGLIAALPNVQGVMAARTLGVLIFDVIDRVPKVHSEPDAITDVQLKEKIEFRDVTFKYPTAPLEFRPVLVNANFTISAGQSTAIVGPSGSGKSTIVQLIERFYDPINSDKGSICFDGLDIRKLSLKALRENIGYVSQEPVMIMGTVRDNLFYGNCDATEEDMIEALNMASASFVMEQENGLDAFVGTAGIVNMSGGQKQRIAIARALIKKPKILILDEATSALDPKCEIEVQEAINKISQSGLNLTILMIAHRMSTICSADNLLYFAGRSNLISAAKGTTEYGEIMQKLEAISYAQGDADNEEEMMASSDESDEEQQNRSHSSPSKGATLTQPSDIKNYQTAREFTSFNGQPKTVDFIDKNDDEAQNKSDLSGSINYGNPDEIEAEDPNFGGSAKKNNSAIDRANTNVNISESHDILRSSDTEAGLQFNKKNTQVAIEEQEDKNSLLIQQLRSSTRRSSITTGNKNTIISQIDFDLDPETLNVRDDKKYKDVSYGDIMKFMKPKYHAQIGFIASFCASFNLPLFGYVLSKYIFLLPDAETDEVTFRQDANYWAIIFVILCIMIGLTTGVQKLCFGYCGENITQILRVRVFEALLRKNIGWFDDKSRAPGVLTNMISEDITAINGLTTEVAGVATEAFLGLALSCLTCFVFSWRLALVVTATCPFMVLGGLGMSRLQFNQNAVDDSFRQANALLSDVIINYRTCIAFGDKNLQFILDRYCDLLIIPHEAGLKKAHISGLFFGYSQSVRFAYVAFIFYIAAVLVNRYDEPSEKMFTGCYVVFVGSIGAGVAISMIPSVSKAKGAAKTVLGIIDEPSLIDPKQPGQKTVPTGQIQFNNVSFRYPSRNKYVLKNFNLKVEPNQSVAIVGHSGSGKSTIAQLLLRFYDCSKGNLEVDGVNIKEHDLERYRNNISIVQQEPILFNETIKSNILFGELNAQDVRIKEVATQANAMPFIQQVDEDFSSPAIQSRVREMFQVTARDCLTKRRHVKLFKLQDMVISKKIDYKDLKLASQCISFVSSIGLDSLEQNFEDFIAALKLNNSKADATWKTIMKSFNFRPESKKIEIWLQEEVKTDLLDQANQDNLNFYNEIQEALTQNEGEFDITTVYRFREQSIIQQKNGAKPTKFLNYLKTDRQRVEEYLQTKWDSCINSYKVDQAEEKLDPGFQKMCGLRGGKLSGGQKQRIAIARALIKNPRILILDEATSALDEQSQEIVQQALDRAMEGRTSIVIAHRMSTIKKCNRIVVLHKGKVVEDGSYEELTSNPNGFFTKLEKGIE